MNKTLSRFPALLTISLLPFLTGCNREAGATSGNGNGAAMGPIVGEEVAVLSTAPNVPPPITRRKPTKLIVNLEVIEKEMPIADGVSYTFWTFGGGVPGKFIRTRVGDRVEFNLHNHPDNRMPHNIDLHAVTGPGGGAASSFVAPGYTAQFSFRTLNPGLYVYHCATAPVGMHIANGMYGLILVEPAEGYPKVDKEYYVMQGEFYTRGGYGEEGLQPFSMAKAMREDADYVLFNGRVGALVGDNAITAKVGETVRLYVGNGGPNLVSSFHVIGEIFDLAYTEAGENPNRNVQTTLIPAGGATIVQFKCEVPGTFIIVDHSIFRTFNKGALGMLKVTGKKNQDVYSGKQDDRVYLPEGGAIQEMPARAAKKAPKTRTMQERMALGERTYNQICAACHQPDGMGVPSAFPPLAKSDYLMADTERAILAIVNGLQGPIVVSGKKFNSVMPAVKLTNDEIANVLTYARNSWGNEGGKVSRMDVVNAKMK